MNIENTKTLIRHLATCTWVSTETCPKNNHSFNMGFTIYGCGSPCCVAGHCTWLSGKGQNENTNERGIVNYLEVDHNTAKHIFNGRYSKKYLKGDLDPYYLGQITIDETIGYLEQLIEEERKNRKHKQI